VAIEDTTGAAITIIDASVFSSPILVSGAKWTAFTSAELGSASFVANSGVVSVSNSYGFTTINVTGASPRAGAGNYNINL
jgi:hypothetical protein